jgi:translation initiation factor IF-1
MAGAKFGSDAFKNIGIWLILAGIVIAFLPLCLLLIAFAWKWCID